MHFQLNLLQLRVFQRVLQGVRIRIGFPNAKCGVRSKVLVLQCVFQGFHNTESSKVNKVPLLLKQQQMQKSTQGESWLPTPLKIENPSKYWIQSIIHENVC